MRKPASFYFPHQSLAYLAPVEYIEKELAEICCLVLPIWLVSTGTRKILLYCVMVL